MRRTVRAHVLLRKPSGSAHGWEAGEGSCPCLRDGGGACTEPEQYFHSSVREERGLTIGSAPTHTDLESQR